MGIGELIKMVRRYPCGKNNKTSEILVVSPVYILDNIEGTPFGELFGKESIVRSKQLFSRYQRVCLQYGCNCLDAAQFAKASPVDAVHIDTQDHQKLAMAIGERIKVIFSAQSELYGNAKLYNIEAGYPLGANPAGL